MEERFEVWFNDGLFRAFPKVDTISIEREGTCMRFKFGDSNPKHQAVLNLNNVNFMEVMRD